MLKIENILIHLFIYLYGASLYCKTAITFLLENAKET